MKKANIGEYFGYAAVALLSAGAYVWLNALSDGAIKALLDFYKTAVEIFFGNELYFNQYTFRYAGDYFTIGKECLGLNIIVLLFFVCAVLSVKALRGVRRILGVLLSAPAAVVAGVFANIFRLISSIYFITFVKFATIHALLGIVIYLSVLIAFQRFFIWLQSRAAAEDGAAYFETDMEREDSEDTL